MDELVSINETTIRLVIFLGVLSAVATLESKFPRRAVDQKRGARWPSNIGISLLSQLLVRAIVPISAVLFSTEVAARGWGLLNLISVPVLIEVMIAVLLFDLVIYWQHRIFHIFSPLWRLHRMHHADTVFDVTTGIRFHPLSILISIGLKLITVALIGPSVVAVLLFEILLNATSLFNHSNLKVPASLDRLLRFIVVTPDMHRIHHSTDNTEMNCNFGFNFPWWDRLFRTYKQTPDLTHEGMEIGLSQFRSADESRLDKMFTQPFRNG